MSRLFVAAFAEEQTSRIRAHTVCGSLVYGGAISALQGWTFGERFVSESGWEPAALLAALVDRYPDGVAPDSRPWLKGLVEAQLSRSS